VDVRDAGCDPTVLGEMISGMAWGGRRDGTTKRLGTPRTRSRLSGAIIRRTCLFRGKVR